MPLKKSVIIPNSVDFTRLMTAEQVSFRVRYGIKRDFLLYVGRFARHKCVDFLVRNHVAVKDLALDLVLIGQDDGDLNRVRELVKATGLEGHIHIFHSISFEEVCAAFREAVALVMASRYEGLPTVILEAAAFGTPSVAPRVGGIPFVIDDGRNGHLYDWGSDEGYVSSIRELAANRMGLAEVVRSEILVRFSWGANARSVAETYGTLASMRPKKETTSPAVLVSVSDPNIPGQIEKSTRAN
jgi:starch synthase